jgi:hypothetical protein
MSIQGFSSILMQFMPKNSNACVLHISTQASSVGKSLALTMCSSVWGPHERYKVSADTSKTTMMQRAGLWGSLPLNIDEVTDIQRKSNGEFIPSVTFAYSQGAHKIKGSAGGNTEVSHELMWAGKMLMTSNSPAFESMLGARLHSSHGEVRRLLEWHVPDGELTWTDEERDTLANAGRNYGVVGRVFAEWCVRNREKAETVALKMAEYWRKEACAPDDERFWTSSIGADLAACILLSKENAGIVDIPVSGIQAFWLEVVSKQRKMMANNKTTALDLLHRYVADNSGGFIKTHSGVITQALSGFGKLQADSAKGAVRGRVETDDVLESVSFYVEEKLMRIHCGLAGVSYTSFLAELGTQAGVTTVRKDLLAGTNGPTMRLKCLKVVQNKKDVGEELI